MAHPVTNVSAWPLPVAVEARAGAFPRDFLWRPLWAISHSAGRNGDSFQLPKAVFSSGDILCALDPMKCSGLDSSTRFPMDWFCQSIRLSRVTWQASLSSSWLLMPWLKYNSAGRDRRGGMSFEGSSPSASSGWYSLTWVSGTLTNAFWSQTAKCMVRFNRCIVLDSHGDLDVSITTWVTERPPMRLGSSARRRYSPIASGSW